MYVSSLETETIWNDNAWEKVVKKRDSYIIRPAKTNQKINTPLRYTGDTRAGRRFRLFHSYTVVLTRWHGAFSSKSHKQDQDLIFWHGRVHLAGYWQAVNQEKKSHIRSLLIEWHLSNRPCEGRNIKQFRVLRAFTWCTGHRWCKTKDLFVFCSSVKSVWLCFMVFVLLFYVICVRYHEVSKCRTSVTIPY